MTTRPAQTRWRSLDTLFNAGTLGALSDPELLECFRADRGDASQEAFRILVERHGPMVLGLCRSLIRDPHEAEDAFQATFLVLVRKGRAIWVRDSVGPWLYGVASRVARRARQRSILRRRDQVRLVGDVADAETGRSPEGEMGAEPVIREEIAGLPASLRAPIVLCALEGLTYDAAARQLGVSEPTLRGRLHRGRRRLESRLRRRGILSPLAATTAGPFPWAVAAVPPALVQSTVRHAAWWSSIGGLVVGESAIPASIAGLARGVIRSMVLNTWRAAGIVAVLAVGVLGTVVWAQQGTPAKTDAAAAPAVRPAAREPDRPVAPAPAPRPLPPQFQALVAQHEAHQERIRTLKCTIDERASIDGGQTWKDLFVWKVWKDGPRERIHRTIHRVLKGSAAFEVVKAPRGELDVLLTLDGVRSMWGYDPAHPPAEPVAIRDEFVTGNRLSGLIRPALPRTVGGYRTGNAADYLLLTLVDVMYSLRDLCEAEVNAGVRPVERRDEQGRVLWDLRLKAPPGHASWDVRHEMPEGKYYSYVLTLSPEHGYAVIESDRITRMDKSERGTAANLEIHDTNRVLEFQEPALGVYLPRRIRRARSRSDAEVNPSFLGENVIHDVVINGPITDQELDLRFPQGLAVGVMNTDTFYIWGDGAPARRLTTDEYNEERKREMQRVRGRVID
jgi:RNA polymerase sigma factor (sigma-70 family)